MKDEILNRIRELAPQVKGMYRNSMHSNLDQFAFEVAQQANTSEIEKACMIRAAGAEIVELSLKLHPDVQLGDKYIETV